jgi:hypothetical protein
MSAATILPFQLRLTQEAVRHFRDADLLQVIVLTDATMYRRLLTDNEIANFWLVIDERRQRAQGQTVSVLCRRFGPRRSVLHDG